ncbi:MAG: hypothetical protein MJ081_05000 [Ruminococcus sp.]|nr:hypothetical protein [Ruminococcus sp.]
MKKRYLPLIASALSILCLIGGCGHDGDAKDNLSTENATEQSMLSENDSLLNSSIHLLGNNITLPCKFSKFGDIRFDSSVAVVTDDNGLYGAIYNGDYRIGRIIISDYSADDKDINNKMVTYLELKPDFGFDDLDVAYNGFTYKTSKNTLVDSFGKPDEEYDNNVCYHLKNEGYIEFEFTQDFTEIESIKIKAE